MIVKGYAAHWHKKNKNNERLEMGAFDEIIDWFEKNEVIIPINVEHDNNEIIGKVISMKKDNKGLFVEAEIFDNLVNAEHYKELIVNGLFQNFSTQGFVGNKAIKNLPDGSYMVSKFRLTAIAVTNQPADTNARLSIASCLDEGKFLTWNNEYDDEKINKLSVYSLL